jgi:hypothetical protein
MVAMRDGDRESNREKYDEREACDTHPPRQTRIGA